MPANKTVFHWSSGKDSALALYYLLQDSRYKVDKLITTINEHYGRVTMHGTPQALLEKQVESLGIDHDVIKLSQSASMEAYEQQMKESMNQLSSKGFTQSAFGDIFLEDLKSYREKEMNRFGFKTVFPLWKKNTSILIDEFLSLGFKAVIVCANDRLGERFLGRTIDQSFIEDLPVGIDPCGEHGEFHTFCYDGPIFKKPISFRLGEKTKRSYPNPSGDGEVDFWFQDLL
ncbi:MAG: diphthine--ammonia ligase [Ekhidna sp.]